MTTAQTTDAATIRFFTPRKARELTAAQAALTDVFELEGRPAKRLINADDNERAAIFDAIDRETGARGNSEWPEGETVFTYVLSLIDGWTDDEVAERLRLDSLAVPFLRRRFGYWPVAAVFHLCNDRGFSITELPDRARAAAAERYASTN